MFATTTGGAAAAAPPFFGGTPQHTRCGCARCRARGAGSAWAREAGAVAEEQEFRAAALPRNVREAMALGVLGWPLAVKRAAEAGIRDAGKLADIVFFLHHPERITADGLGRPLDPAESNFNALVTEWRAWRTLAQAFQSNPKPVPAGPTPAAPAGPAPGGGAPLRYGVPGGVVGSPFDNLRKGAYTGYHLGIDVSTDKKPARAADDPRRGLPVYFTPRLTLSRAEIDSARLAHDRAGPIQRGLGLPAGGDATLERAEVMATSQHTKKDHGYGTLVRLACLYGYRRADGAMQRFTLQIEYLHLITPETLPVYRKDGSTVTLAEWTAAGKAGRLGLGPRMVRGSVFTHDDLATASGPPLVGYLGATVWPHVHIQVVLSVGGSTKYVKRPRVDPALAIH